MRYRYGADEGFDAPPAWLFEGMASAFRNGAARLAIVRRGSGAAGRRRIPDKVARANRARSKAYKPALEQISNFAINWTIVSCRHAGLGTLVFPERAGGGRRRAASGTRSSRPRGSTAPIRSPPGRRTTPLSRRAREAQRQALCSPALPRARAPTSRSALPTATSGTAAPIPAKNGIVCNPNIPTEEVFTTPHKDRVDGHVTQHQAALLSGHADRGHRRAVRGGPHRRGVATPGGEAVLRKVLDTDEGASPARRGGAGAEFRRRSRRAGCCSTTRSSTRTPRATSRSARPTASASRAAAR